MLQGNFRRDVHAHQKIMLMLPVGHGRHSEVTCRLIWRWSTIRWPRRVQPILDKLGIGVWNPEKVVLISDHYVPAVDAESARILDMTRKFHLTDAHFYDMQGFAMWY